MQIAFDDDNDDDYGVRLFVKIFSSPSATEVIAIDMINWMSEWEGNNEKKITRRRRLKDNK